MPSLIDIRRRIRSVKNTQQITKAMKMVSAAKLPLRGPAPYLAGLACIANAQAAITRYNSTDEIAHGRPALADTPIIPPVPAKKRVT